MNPQDYAKHEKETMAERLDRLNRQLGRKEKHRGEHAIIKAAIAKIEKRAKKRQKAVEKQKKGK